MNLLPSAFSTFNSTVESVDAAEKQTREYAESVGFEEPDQYFIGLALREIFINAVKHGNGFDSNKRVVLRLSNSSEGMIIEVIDEGNGFRLSEVPNPRAPENLERRSGRGVILALGIMDEFAVERHRPEGTHVRMAKRLAKR